MRDAGPLLRVARQRLGRTQKEAAEALGVSQPLLSRLENGAAEPDPDFLARAARAYAIPERFFTSREPVFGPPVSVHAMTRARGDVPARDLEVMTAELNLRLIHLNRLMVAVDLAAPADLPALDVEQYGGPERCAATVRAHWGVPQGPVRELVRLVERAGVVVGMSHFRGASISGVTFRAPGRPPLIVVNAAHPGDRQRFTLAHELGHLVMHRFPSATMEQEADGFASALLMPAADLRPALAGRQVTLPLLAALKREWRVSMQSLLMRASALGAVTPNQARYLWQQLSARGWRLREPAELEIDREVPRALDQVIRYHLDDLGYSPAELATLLDVHEKEFVDLYGDFSPASAPRPRLRVVR